MNLSADRFSEFFQAIYDGFEPFPWQKRLAAQVINNSETPWPACLALPTGAGKTTCIDIAVFSLACQANRPQIERTAPRKIIFVVDRRIIVDEAFEHSLDLAEKLQSATSGILREVADALLQIAGADRLNPLLAEKLFPLTCHQLRGGMYRDDAWARTPTQPCVIATTVDQIGSRLLFRAYGRSSRAWGLQAGLAGNDSLIILDEAHCANPFYQTMKAVSTYRNWRDECVGGPFHVAIMSATPPDGVEPFEADEDDENHPVLGERIARRKLARLVIAEKAKGNNALVELAVAMIEQAAQFAVEGHRRVGILVNRVRTATMITQLLEAARDKVEIDIEPRYLKQTAKCLSTLPGTFDVVLLTGRMRPIDRDRLMAAWQPQSESAEHGQTQGLLTWFGTSSNRPQMPSPAFVVATQCLEVGANLDFDALVTECASLDALRQRFGRLDRVARTEHKVREDQIRSAVVVRFDQTSEGSEDAVYGTSIGHTWTWMNANASIRTESETEQDRDAAEQLCIDFGIRPMTALVEDTDTELRLSLNKSVPNAPVMLPAHVDCWVQTSPEPEPTPDPAVFLHGPDQSMPEVQICWRADLPKYSWSEDPDERLAIVEDRIATVAFSPPSILECMPVSLVAFRRWWADSSVDAGIDTADVNFVSDHDIPNWKGGKNTAVIWRGPEHSELYFGQPRQIRPGDTIVLSVASKCWNVFGHIPRTYKVKAVEDLSDLSDIDVGDRCQVESRRRAILRLHPELIAGWPESSGKADLLSLLKTEEADRHEMLQLLADCRPERTDDKYAWLRQAIEAICKSSKRRKWVELPHDPQFRRTAILGVYATGLLKPVARLRAYQPETWSSEDHSNSGNAVVPLLEHCSNVGRLAGQFAALCGLGELADLLRAVGKVHDLGKADQRFQTFLFGGNRVRAQLETNAYAKSNGLRPAGRTFKDAWTRSGLPNGFRHELLSLQIVENLLPGDLEGIHLDLYLHLIAAHHGQARPFASVVINDSESSSDFADALGIQASRIGLEQNVTEEHRKSWIPPHRFDSGVSDRFWRLTRHYGWWGLAYIEAVFMLADHRQSECEECLQSQEKAAERPSAVEVLS